MTIEQALQSASQTRACVIGAGAISRVEEVFRQQFGGKAAVVVADNNTFPIAGKRVHDAIKGREPFVFTDPKLYAEYAFVTQLEKSLKEHDAVPIAVGSGTINDLTKLAAHRAGREYMCVATAASMDGYTAYGASITYEGSKQTFDCPAPRAAVADLEIIAGAHKEMNASGYADLLAKFTAGADWIVADSLGIERIDPKGWEIVQSRLRGWTNDPAGVRSGNLQAISNLLEGLMMGGFAMQWTKSSRVASGAEHQFSHLWDMQHHMHDGKIVSHGFKVGIGTLASARMYEELLSRGIGEFDVDAWPSWDAVEKVIRTVFSDAQVAAKATEETKAKYVDRETLRARLAKLKAVWPTMIKRIEQQLPTPAELREKLLAAGAPYESEQIGISQERLNQSHLQAYFIRRRYTVLDLMVQTGKWVEWAGSIA